MNQRDLMKRRNDSARLLDLRMKGKRNAIHLGANETVNHAMTKAFICHWLTIQGKEFYTEAMFSKGLGRADIFVLDTGIAIEVVDSEDLEKEVKSGKYPCKIIWILASDFLMWKDLAEHYLDVHLAEV